MVRGQLSAKVSGEKLKRKGERASEINKHPVPSSVRQHNGRGPFIGRECNGTHAKRTYVCMYVRTNAFTPDKLAVCNYNWAGGEQQVFIVCASRTYSLWHKVVQESERARGLGGRS